MRLHIFSDLHLEFAPLQPEKPKADVMIAAGDIEMALQAWPFDLRDDMHAF